MKTSTLKALDTAIEDALVALSEKEAVSETYNELAAKVAELIQCSAPAAKALIKAHRAIRLQDTSVQLTLNFQPIAETKPEEPPREQEAA